MRILRFLHDGSIGYGALEGDSTVCELATSPFVSLELSGREFPLSETRVLSPVESPRVIGVGLNYAEHAREAGVFPPLQPMLFMKPSTAVIGPEEPIIYPRQGQRVDYEAELAVVIGKEARRISEADALDYVLGYTCGNDISERIIQRAEMDEGCLLIGKGFDTFCPQGPVITTDADPSDFQVRSRVNGELKQDASTSDLIFSVPHLVSYISQAITLQPGDIIMTGTPSGVGPVHPGDIVEIEISGIGILRNPVVAEE